MSPHHTDQMSQWSQVSRMALCMAKVKVSDLVSELVSELVTRSPIELFWTAKKGDKIHTKVIINSLPFELHKYLRSSCTIRSGDKKSQLQLSRRELLLLLLQTRCSYSCFCSKALSRHMKVQVVDISRATQVQGAGLPFQLSHVQDYPTTYHSMLTTPSRQIGPNNPSPITI